MAINKEDIEKMLEEEFDGANITAAGADASFQVRVVSGAFEGMNAVKRQQAVYRVLNPHISSGDIHAINMQLLTPGEEAAAGD